MTDQPAINFDTDQDFRRGRRLAMDFTFVLGGETFELRHGLRIGSTALDDWYPALDRMLANEEERAAPDFKPLLDAEFVDVWERVMLNILLPGQETKLRKVTAENDASPLMLADYVDVMLWAVGRVTGRPTQASPGSSDGSTAPTPELAAASSAGASSSPEGAAPTT